MKKKMVNRIFLIYFIISLGVIFISPINRGNNSSIFEYWSLLSKFSPNLKTSPIDLKLETSVMNWSITEVVSTESTDYTSRPVVTIDASGNVHVAWVDYTDYGGAGGGDDDIFYKFWNISDGTWNGHINATDVISSESNDESSEPSLAVDSSGNVHVAWVDPTVYGGAGDDYDIFYKFWNASAGTWSGHINATDVVSTVSVNDSSDVSLAIDIYGNVHIAWEDSTDYGGAGADEDDIFYKFWNASTNAWSGTDVVSTESTNESQSPSLAVDTYGNVHVAWFDWTDYGGAGEDYDVFYKFKSNISSTWSATEVVSTQSTNLSYYLSLAADVFGNVHVAWEDLTDYGGAGTDWDIFYKFRNSSSGIWGGHISATDVISTESVNCSDSPSLDVDSSGNVHIAWDDITDYGGAGGDGDIFYKFWNTTSGSWSGQVSATDVVSTESTGYSYYSSLTVDATGNVHVVWVDDTIYGGSGSDDDIFYKHLSDVSVNYVPIFVSTPGNTSYIYGSIGNTLEWNVTDIDVDNPNYTVYLDSNPLVGEINKSWTYGVNISINVDGLSLGAHNITIVVEDGLGEEIQDYVNVTVTQGIINPNNNSRWYTDTYNNITWGISAAITSVDIELWKNGLYNMTIATNVTNSITNYSYSWYTPLLSNSSDYQIIIYDNNSHTTNFTSNDFTIVPDDGKGYYGYDSNIGIMLCLDKSGSMWNEITQLKDAALLILDAIPDDYFIGLVAYDTSAAVYEGMNQKSNGTHLQDMKIAINSLYAGGLTNIYEGLIDSIQEFNASSFAEKYIILMSDGHANRGKSPFNTGNPVPWSTNPDSPAVIANNESICIYTVAFGPGADKILMETIANTSGCGESWEIDKTNSAYLPITFAEVGNTIMGISDQQQTLYGSYNGSGIKEIVNFTISSIAGSSIRVCNGIKISAVTGNVRVYAYSSDIANMDIIMRDGEGNVIASIASGQGARFVWEEFPLTFDMETVFIYLDGDNAGDYGINIAIIPPEEADEVLTPLLPLTSEEPVWVYLVIVFGSIAGLSIALIYKRKHISEEPKTKIKKSKIPDKVAKEVISPKKSDIDIKLQKLRNAVDVQQFKLDNYKKSLENGTISEDSFLNLKVSIENKIAELKNQIEELEKKKLNNQNYQ